MCRSRVLALFACLVLIFLSSGCYAQQEGSACTQASAGKACWGHAVDADTADAEITLTQSALFWAVFALVVFGYPLGYYLHARRDPESLVFQEWDKRWFPMKHEFGLLEAYTRIFDNAILIVLAMLWSSAFEAAFASLYYAMQGAGEAAEDEACPTRIGSYACGFGDEGKELKWAIILPAFFAAIVVVLALLYLVAKYLGRYWVEFTAGVCGHLIGFRLLDGIVKKLYGELKFSDYFRKVGQQSKHWNTYSDPRLIPSGAEATNLWNASSSAWQIDQVTLGSVPTLRDLGNEVVGNVPSAMEAMAKQAYAAANATDPTTNSAIGGIGENPAVENPWCFFVQDSSKFVCYVSASLQEASPLFWPEDGAYQNEFGNRAWKLIAFGLLCTVFLLVVRYLHEEVWLGWLFNEGVGQTRQEKMDGTTHTNAHAPLPHSSSRRVLPPPLFDMLLAEKEFDDAVEDVFNDAAGNAFGWLIASLAYWIVVGFVVWIQPSGENVQYGTSQPAIIAFCMLGFCYLALNVSTIIELGATDEHSTVQHWLQKIHKYAHGFGQTIQSFGVGYLIFMLW